jgi:hypothetical protein
LRIWCRILVIIDNGKKRIIASVIRAIGAAAATAAVGGDNGLTEKLLFLLRLFPLRWQMWLML